MFSIRLGYGSNTDKDDRADLENEKVKKEYERGYATLLDFYHKSGQGSLSLIRSNHDWSSTMSNDQGGKRNPECLITNQIKLALSFTKSIVLAHMIRDLNYIVGRVMFA